MIKLITVFIASTLVSQVLEKNLKDHVYYLASDELEGRGANSSGFDKAVDYSIKLFKQSKLKPGLNDTFVQQFTLADSLLGKLTNKQNHQPALGKNVIALLEGSDPDLKESYIVISAHLDHKGMIEGEIFNGANDNATGSSSVIELARSLSKVKLKRSILFVLFGAEEIGMIGSDYFVKNPPVPLKSILFNINLDGIGAYINQEADSIGLLAVGANVDCAKFQDFMLDLNQSTSKLNLVTDDPNYYFFRSDQFRFYQKRVPAIMFTDYGNGNYHKTTDDAHRLQYGKFTEVVKFVHIFAKELSNTTLTFCE